MYKYLLWDIDGTLMDFLAQEKYAIQTLFREYGFGECTDEMVASYSKINVSYWEKLERGEVEKPAMLVARFRDFFEQVGVDVSKAEEFNAKYQVTIGDCVVFMKDAMEVLQEEKGNHILVAVTNGTKVAQTRKLRASGLDQIFDYVFISEDVGFEKPSVEYFDKVFETAGITDKKEALIIGDSMTSDILGGINAGIDTCWFNPSGEPNHRAYKATYEIKELAEIRHIVG